MQKNDGGRTRREENEERSADTRKELARKGDAGADRKGIRAPAAARSRDYGLRKVTAKCHRIAFPAIRRTRSSFARVSPRAATRPTSSAPRAYCIGCIIMHTTIENAKV